MFLPPPLELYRHATMTSIDCTEDDRPGTIEFTVKSEHPLGHHVPIEAQLCRMLRISQQVPIAFYVKDHELVVGADMFNGDDVYWQKNAFVNVYHGIDAASGTCAGGGQAGTLDFDYQGVHQHLAIADDLCQAIRGPGSQVPIAFYVWHKGGQDEGLVVGVGLSQDYAASQTEALVSWSSEGP